MFTDLAFIDWIALIFAALLLAAAAAAGLVAYATTKSRQKMPVHAAELRSAPAHAAPGHAAPAHAATTEVQLATPEHAARIATPPPTPVDANVDGPPAPPILVSTQKNTNAVMSDGVRIEASNSSTTPEDTVAARAAKLRGRPTPEQNPTRKRVVSMAEPARMPAHAPNRAFVGAHERSGVSIEMDRTAGFSARTPGFFEDPVGRHELRYWDGHRWTEYVKEHGERFTDPL